jgi:hypothetical protein
LERRKDKKKSTSITEYCKLTATHPDLYTNYTENSLEYSHKWEIEKTLQDKVKT